MEFIMSRNPIESVDELLQKGVRNIWYGICPSGFIADKPVSLRRCGYKMVLWRGLNGQLHALEDHCPHRGAPLSMGINMDDRIAYFTRLRDSLKPGAEVVIIDFNADSPVGPPKSARVAAAQVGDEMTRAGYAQVAQHGFLPYQYFLVFKPQP